MTAKTEQAEQNFARFTEQQDRIEGSIHNTVNARLGTAFNFLSMEETDAVEIAFANEPHGNMRSILVVDLNAARTLRDRLNALIHEHERDVCRARRQAARANREE
ncbi:MAG: hypothetical protein ACFUZC_17035 [Chthoniobacteraceae bacterium]